MSTSDVAMIKEHVLELVCISSYIVMVGVKLEKLIGTRLDNAIFNVSRMNNFF